MNSNSVDSDKAMKRGDEVLNASSLYHYNFFSALIPSPLLFKANHRLMLHRRYFLKRFIA
jgi:hypothetical protein